MEEIDALRFNVARSIRYHDKRRGFFEMLGKALQFVALIGSSAAVVSLLNQIAATYAALIFSSVAAAATLFNLVVGCPSKLETHTKLRNRFIDLLSEIERCREPTHADVQRFTKERLQIEKEEPTTSSWLNKICYNETVDALGYDESAKRPVKFYYYLGNLKPY